MPIGFNMESNLQIYGDGEGHIVIEEWSDDEFSDCLGKVKISVERFRQINEMFFDHLINEAIYKDTNTQE